MLLRQGRHSLCGRAYGATRPCDPTSRVAHCGLWSLTGREKSKDGERWWKMVKDGERQILSSPNSLGVVKDGECVSGQCKNFNATATLPEGFQTIFPTTSDHLWLIRLIRPRTLHELHVRRPGRARVAGLFASPFGTRRGANVTKNIKEHQRLFQIQVLFVCLFVARLNPLERLGVGCWSWMLVDVHEAEESHFRHLDTFVWSLEWACLGQLKRLRRQPATVCRLFKSFINNLYIIL